MYLSVTNVNEANAKDVLLRNNNKVVYITTITYHYNPDKGEYEVYCKSVVPETKGNGHCVDHYTARHNNYYWVRTLLDGEDVDEHHIYIHDRDRVVENFFNPYPVTIHYIPGEKDVYGYMEDQVMYLDYLKPFRNCNFIRRDRKFYSWVRCDEERKSIFFAGNVLDDEDLEFGREITVRPLFSIGVNDLEKIRVNYLFQVHGIKQEMYRDYTEGEIVRFDTREVLDDGMVPVRISSELSKGDAYTEKIMYKGINYSYGIGEKRRGLVMVTYEAEDFIYSLIDEGANIVFDTFDPPRIDIQVEGDAGPIIIGADLYLTKEDFDNAKKDNFESYFDVYDDTEELTWKNNRYFVKQPGVGVKLKNKTIIDEDGNEMVYDLVIGARDKRGQVTECTFKCYVVDTSAIQINNN